MRIAASILTPLMPGLRCAISGQASASRPSVRRLARHAVAAPNTNGNAADLCCGATSGTCVAGGPNSSLSNIRIDGEGGNDTGIAVNGGADGTTTRIDHVTLGNLGGCRHRYWPRTGRSSRGPCSPRRRRCVPLLAAGNRFAHGIPTGFVEADQDCTAGGTVSRSPSCNSASDATINIGGIAAGDSTHVDVTRCE
jgi:hypothetical protein